MRCSITRNTSCARWLPGLLVALAASGMAGAGPVAADNAPETSVTADDANPASAANSANPASPTATSATAAAANRTIRNGDFWRDTSGAPIYSQGGGVLKVGDRYYWYGVKYEEAVRYIEDRKADGASTKFNAVTAYSSLDLVNWTNEGEVIKVAAPGKIFERDAWLGRLGVVYRPRTKKYVLITQYGSKSAGNGVLFATSDTPTGPFTYHSLQTQVANVNGPATGDQTVFIDDDGQPYLVFSNSGERRHLYVAPLRASDFLQVEPATLVHQAPAGGREGNAMFKHNGLYYFCSSELHGWNASRSYYMTAASINGPYSPERLIEGTEADFSHVSQNGFFIPVTGGKQGMVLFAGDRWSNYAGNGDGYNIWVPLTFEGTAPVFHSLSEFSLDAKSGAWQAGKGNNYVRNPGFEADRVAQTGVAGWVVSWTNLKGPSPTVNVMDSRSGRWALTLAHDQHTMGSAVQNVTLPNGRYTLKAWVKSSGGQKVARLYAYGHGGPEAAVSLATARAGWTEVTVPGVAVSNGSVQVGLYSEGRDGQWLKVDDVSLVAE